MNKRMTVQVLCVKIETRKCKNGFPKDFPSAKKSAEKTKRVIAEFCPVTPFYISFSDTHNILLHK